MANLVLGLFSVNESDNPGRIEIMNSRIRSLLVSE